MRNSFQVSPPLAVVAILSWVTMTSPGAAWGDEHKTNACGCYQDTAGQCICTRKSKCNCPGECEPKGCEEKRQKEIDREIKEETQKAQAADKKRQEEEAAKERKAAEQSDEESDSEATDDSAAKHKDAAAPAESKGGKNKKDRKPHAKAP